MLSWIVKEIDKHEQQHELNEPPREQRGIRNQGVLVCRCVSSSSAWVRSRSDHLDLLFFVLPGRGVTRCKNVD
jgi:hypothetical protein